MVDKTCDSPPRRMSRRNQGQLPLSPSESIKDSPCRELKMLSRTGGRGGKLYDDTTDWDFFPDDLDDYSSDDERITEEPIAFTFKRHP